MNTPPLFHVGQLVTPVENCDWASSAEAAHKPIPRAGKVYEIKKVVLMYWGRWFVGLVEMPGCLFREDCFVPVEAAGDEAIAELLADSLTPVLA